VASALSDSSLDVARLRRLLDVGRVLVSDLDLESVLARVLEAGTDLTGARYAAIGVLADDRRSLERFLTLGVDEATQREIGDLPRGRGVLGVLIDEPHALRLADVGAHPKSYGFPIGHPPMHSFLGVPLLIRGEAWGNLYLAEKEGGEFDDADEEAILTLADLAATAIENARLYRAERQRRDELERAVRGLEATTEIARAVGGETRLDRILELIVKRGRALVEARGMVILLLEADDLVMTAVAGQVPASLVGTRVGIADTACGYVIRERRPHRIGHQAPGATFALAELTGARSGLIVPLMFHGRVVGVLEAFDRLGASLDFSAEDERLMEAFAASAATAVATAQDVAEQTLRRSIAASDRERARWARELHDETLQELSALKITLSTTKRTQEPEAIREGVATALEYSEHAIAGLREIISDLRPAALDALGIQAALETLAERARTRANLDVEMNVDLAFESGRSKTRHAPDLESAVYRITQEAITNTIKHAQARRVTVVLTEIDDVLTLSVQDDGCGFDGEREPDAGFGLIGIRERVELLGGTLLITSQPGAGTRVSAIVPVTRRAEPEA
jgi:two-component system, NarL family, sensor histidine kinase DevS